MKEKQLPKITGPSKLLLFAFMVQMFSSNILLAYGVLAQEVKSVEDYYLDIKFEDQNLVQIFNQIELETGYHFAYDRGKIDERHVFSKEYSSPTSLSNILLDVSRNAGISFKQINKNIIVQKTENIKADEEQPDAVQPRHRVTGKVTSEEESEGLPGVTVVEKNTSNGTVTDIQGQYSLEVSEGATLVFSFVGYLVSEVVVGSQSIINVEMIQDMRQLDEVVVIGYGVQRKSDITGAVASVPQERLEMVPNLNIAQAIQGSMPGVSILTSSSGASPTESIMIRGRNSIRASNDPLIVLDGIPYGGALRDINPNDVASIEILKDASSAAIYGSRGANGVILVTTKKGVEGTTKISYDGYYSFQNHVNYPDYLSGEEFYEFKNIREPGQITQSEQEVYDAGEWVDWYKEGSRNGATHQHNLSVSGGFGDTRYYITGNLLDVKGIAINDNYKRLSGRINLDTKISDWLSIGTRTSYSYDDRSGESPDYNYPTAMLSRANPLTRAYDENRNLTVYIWPEDQSQGNPLAPILYEDTDLSYQIVSNNFVQVDVPFIPGLSYRLNTGIRNRFGDKFTYIGRDTRTGLVVGGQSNTNKSRSDNTIIENILNYNRDFGSHNLFVTGLYSYEKNKTNSNSVSASGFPNDFIGIYSTGQANLITPDYGFNENVLISQMLRVNYTYDSRYLFTVTGRRDGFSGFGADSKWGLFPSFAFGWNLANEAFFPWENSISQLKPRISIGVNGNQAVGAYESISRLTAQNHISAGETQAGYRPSRLGVENLGWESSQTLNFGIDFGIFNDRISGDINYFKTRTTDLLLNRTISSVHGITSIVQNIGETENKGLELMVNSRNFDSKNFQWSTSANISTVKNSIISLYGEVDGEGSELDDVGNNWFIGQPIRVSYDFVWDGVWQLDEAAEAAEYGSKPGGVKLRDVNGDGKLDAGDRQILGQNDPKFLWGLTNSFSYKNFSLNIFIHGVHGIIKNNILMNDEEVWESVRLNTIKKNWWTPENPTNEWIANDVEAHVTGGMRWLNYYEDASFVRVKDITLSYDFPTGLMERLAVDRLRLFANARNLMTFTKFGGLDPELGGQMQFPLQREFVLGVNLSF